MKESKVWAVSAVAGLVIVVLIMLFNIYLDQISVTGAAVAENAGSYRTAAVIVLSLAAMGLVWFIYKLRK